MSWRTVLVSSQAKLDCKMGYMVVRGEETRRVLLDEIAIVVIENPAVAITGCLIDAFIERKIKVIFCDSKRSPAAELVPYHGSHDSSAKIRAQISWQDEIKAEVWREIITEKIRKQADFLGELEKQREADLLLSYLDQVELLDASNREGHAAKVYFNALFGMSFTRSAENAVNAALNYGYTILLSAFNREVAANGYLTQLGIFHSNMFNHFNLSSDLMEPFRILVDREVRGMCVTEFDKSVKYYLWRLLEKPVIIGGTKQTVLNAIKVYTRSVLDALNDRDVSLIRFYRTTEE
ncbi:MAG: type II CRISPR-associated endonuclease Cas1 [Oscillospiraceae bacterium]|nr:type II CRISPR-associated endonuclease Cas1 [Oscillospiraceae bacterium]